jgi:hypothetical protein
MGKKVVLDTSALFSMEQLPTDSEVFVTSGVIKELERYKDRRASLWGELLHVSDASKSSLAKVRKAATETGDSTRISPTDAEDRVGADLEAELLTDDYRSRTCIVPEDAVRPVDQGDQGGPQVALEMQAAARSSTRSCRSTRSRQRTEEHPLKEKSWFAAMALPIRHAQHPHPNRRHWPPNAIIASLLVLTATSNCRPT